MAAVTRSCTSPVKHAADVGPRAAVRDEVAVRIEVQLPFEDFRIRDVAMATKSPSTSRSHVSPVTTLRSLTPVTTFCLMS